MFSDAARIDRSFIEASRVRPAVSGGAWPGDRGRLVGAGEAVTAIRFAVTGTVPLKATHGVLLADEAHRLAGHELTRAGLADPRRQEVLGSHGAATDHRHAHWVPLVVPGQEPRTVRYLVIWVPRGLRAQEIAALLSLRQMSGQRGNRENGYGVRGLPPVELLFQAAGAQLRRS